ncbi:MAG TPA: response regulator transcription factor [Usitatibacter sp.]|nr:response regulator transcription factor [Usitatibacter sp.]
MKVLLIDDHHLIREGLRPVLQQLAEPGEALEVVEASTFRAGLEEAGRHADLELALLDLRLPDVAGFEALAELQSRHPELPVVVMSGEDDPALVRGALERGALGYIPKSSSTAVVLNALRLVLSGGTYVPREIMGGAPSAAPGSAPSPSPAPGAPASAGAAASLGLTPRQADVLALLIAGKSNKEICRALGLAEGTVKNHIAAVFKALRVTTRVQAVIAAAKLGIRG